MFLLLRFFYVFFENLKNVTLRFFASLHTVFSNYGSHKYWRSVCLSFCGNEANAGTVFVVSVNQHLYRVVKKARMRVSHFIVHCEFKKNDTKFCHNFIRCLPICKILVQAHSPGNCTEVFFKGPNSPHGGIHFSCVYMSVSLCAEVHAVIKCQWRFLDIFVVNEWNQVAFRRCTVWVKKNPPWGLVAIFPKQVGISQPNFTRLFGVPRLRIFIQLSATLTKLWRIKCDHPVHILCAKCPPSAETHAGIFWHFSQIVRNFSPKITHLLNVHIYARMQIFVHLSPTVTKLCHIKCHHPACVSVDGAHFEQIV